MTDKELFKKYQEVLALMDTVNTLVAPCEQELAERGTEKSRCHQFRKNFSLLTEVRLNPGQVQRLVQTHFITQQERVAYNKKWNDIKKILNTLKQAHPLHPQPKSSTINSHAKGGK